MKFLKLFFKASNKEKIEFFKYIFNKRKERFINYWLGYIDAWGEYITDVDGNKKLYTYSIIAGKYGKGNWFSEIDAQGIFNLIEQIKDAINKNQHFYLHMNLGCGAFQEYTFDKRQTKILLDKLVELSKEEIYKEE